jgi:hypothetical protein
MDYYKYKLLRCSSENKINSADTNTDFEVDISKITHPATDRCIGVSLIEVAFDNFFYNIRTGINDVFSLQESGQTRVDITFLEGFYSYADIEAKLETDINTNLASGTVVISQDSYNKKIVLTFTGTTAKVLVDATSTMSNTLGFFTSTANFSASITADYIFKLSGVQHAYIDCKEFSHGHLIDSATSNRRDTVSVIPVNQPFGSTVFFSNPNQNSRIIWDHPRNFTVLRFKLTNALGQTLDLQKSNLKMIFALLY